ncbi:Hemicentin-1 [Amphibalanus amphitrite]|uniref:Hemicentin-1 n=1 Tax=Amphibalanus amphitrite TaxID=1232801 RepID=A0A6A4WYL7_AMPAM|nr:Hemicentin-1 [Amphibalanus amphitrite]
MWVLAAVWLLAAGGGAAGGYTDQCRPPEPGAEQVTVAEGSTARLQCPLEAHRSATTWTRPDHPRRHRLLALATGGLTHIERRPGSQRFRLALGRHSRKETHWWLVIEAATPSDAGIYRCYAMYERPERQNAHRLVQLTVVPAGGARLAGPRRRAVVAGRPLTLSCTGRPTLSWRLDGGPLPAAAAVTEGRNCSQLRLAAAAARHAGEYTCSEAAGPETREADSVHVAVVTEVATMVETGGPSDASVLSGCAVIIVLALCCHLCVIEWN